MDLKLNIINIKRDDPQVNKKEVDVMGIFKKFSINKMITGNDVPMAGE